MTGPNFPSSTRGMNKGWRFNLRADRQVRGAMVIFVIAKNTQTTAWRVRTGLT